MTRLLSAEALKLRTTRTPWVIAALAAAVASAITVAVAATIDPATTADPFGTAASPLGMAITAALLLGILQVTTEHRHGTVTASLLATPDRTRFVLSKAVVSAGAGLGLGLLIGALVTALSVSVLESRGIATGAELDDYARTILGNGFAAACAAATGAGVGAVVRNQVGAVIGSLVWLYGVETLLMAIPGVDDVIGRFGLVGLATAANGTAPPNPSVELLPQLPAVVGLAVFAAVFVGAGITVLRRRDVH